MIGGGRGAYPGMQERDCESEQRGSVGTRFDFLGNFGPEVSDHALLRFLVQRTQAHVATVLGSLLEQLDELVRIGGPGEGLEQAVDGPGVAQLAHEAFPVRVAEGPIGRDAGDVLLAPPRDRSDFGQGGAPQ